MNKNAIGLFDSGFGGITVLSELSKYLPGESFVYVADSKRAPYGDKSKKELWDINVQIISFLKSVPIKILIFACNTSNALFYDQLKDSLDIPIIGLIKPSASIATTFSKNKRICILATSRTVEEQAYKKALLAIDDTLAIKEIACPELVPFVENGKVSTEKCKKIALDYLQEALSFKPDSIILGCSHFPFLLPIWRPALPQGVTLIDPSKCVTEAVLKTLVTHGLSNSSKTQSINLHVNGDVNILESFIIQHTAIPIQNIKLHALNFSKKIPVNTFLEI